MNPISVLLFLAPLVILQASPFWAQQAGPTQRPQIDRYGRRLPLGALQRLGDPLQARGAINAIAISPNGRHAALAHTGHMIYLWNRFTGEEVGRFTGHQAPVTAVAFAPDGSALASASDDGTVRIWDIALGKEKRRFTAHTREATAVAYSPDGAILASGAWDDKVYLWEAASGKKLRELNVGAAVNALAFSADGNSLAAGTYAGGGRDPVRVWDIATGSERGRISHEHGSVYAVSFSPDAKMLASANDYGTVELVEVATGRLIRRFQGHDGNVKCVAFSPDGRILASSAARGTDRSIRLWEVATGQMCLQLFNPADFTVAVAFTPDGTVLISGGWERTALVWPLGIRESRQKPRPAPTAPEWAAMWETLKQPDAPRAYAVIWKMVAWPEASVHFLGRKVRPATAVLVDARAIADLDSPSFPVREKAMAQLEGLPEAAATELRHALAQHLSTEARRRLELVLRKLESKRLGPEELRTLRALQILEQVGNREARALLETLGRGAPGANLTREARAALGRLDRRAAVTRRLVEDDRPRTGGR